MATRMGRRVVLLFAVWLVLTGGSPEAWAAGLVAAVAAAALSLALAPRPIAVRPAGVLALAPRFLTASVAGGWDVSWRALHPRRPVDPGWILYRTRLPVGGPRVALGGELSLQPGTLVAGAKGDRLLVHALNRRSGLRDRIGREEARIWATIRRPEPPA